MDYYNYPKPSPLDEFRHFFREGSALSNLIVINSVIWILIQVLRVVYFLLNQYDRELVSGIVQYFALPASLTSLFAEPWTLITYMFLHIDIWHILFNMLWLFWFGKIFMQYLGPRRLTVVYLLGGLAGGLVYIFAFNTFPVFSESLDISRALGASASVMAIVTAISFYVPAYTINLMFLGRIKIVYLAIILFIFDFFMIPAGNSGGHIAHIGGALLGFIYIQFVPGIKSNRTRPGIFGNLFSGIKTASGRKSPPRGASGSRPVTDDEYNRQKNQNQKRIDAILEKISRGGYDSLTKEEKEFLFKTSNRR